MSISRLVLENFRNFENLDLSLNQGFIVLSGPNGAGKTNFLESIYFGSLLRRFPDSKFNQLFRTGSDYFRIKITSARQEQTLLEAFVEKREQKYFYQLKSNNQIQKRRHYAGNLPVVSFLPQDLNLLTRSPGNRRRYLDETLVSTSASYRHALSSYEKVLRQRNELLVNLGQYVEVKEKEIWDEQLADFGSQIDRARKTFLDYVNARLAKLIFSLSPGLAPVSIGYLNAGAADKNEFLEKLAASKSREQALGSTVIGPHRDDFSVTAGGQDAVGYVSRGQLRIITLALKILEKQYLEEVRKASPVMLLDDIFSEFDSQHREKLIEFARTLPQVFITTANLTEVSRFLPNTAAVFTVSNGVVSGEK